ncbi:TonB-dependent receptor [Marinomonas fungiae]|uniref:TonB-dependent receptor n=1 Tax=Marinomonas fungiae TaxID=1137284 RepID=UPI003A9248A1
MTFTMKPSKTLIPSRLSCVAYSIILINSMLAASVASAENIALEALIVTGEKRDKSIKDTTTAVTVIKGEALESGEVNQATEVVLKAPNVQTDSFGSIAIRGMSGGGAATGGAALITGSRARISTVVDGSTQDWSGYNFIPKDMWDVEQVEVLRGPQSTTQGATAIAGAVVINTKDPSFEPEAAVRAGLEHYENGHLKHNLAVMSSGPLIKDELAYRIALEQTKGEGWLNYDSKGYDTPNLNESESNNVRGKLLWEPNSIPELSAKLTLNYHQNEGEHASFATNTTEGIETRTLELATTTARVQDSSENAIALDVDYEISTSITNSLHISRIDSDIYADGYMANYLFFYDIQQVSNSIENRLIFDSNESKLSGVLGVYFSTKDSSIYADQNLIIDTDYTTDTSAVYGETTYALTDKLATTFGLRIENEEIDKTGSFYTSGNLKQDSSETYYLPKLGMTYAVTDSTTVGVSLGQGYSPGGSGITFAGEVYDYDSEEVTSLEFSSKTYFQNGTSLNANLFYNDYTDYQALSGLALYNVERAHIYGFELEARKWVTDDLELWSALGLLKSKIDRNSNYEGNELSSAPETNAAVGFTQYIGEQWSVGGDINYVGQYYADLSNSADVEVGDAAITNLRAQYTVGQLTVNGYIKNVTDEDIVYYRTGLLATVGQSRTVGISGTYRF